MTRIAILPLDDRPQTYGFSAPLALIGQVEPVLPPLELMGRFLTPGRPEALRDWLYEVAPRADALVVALDMLAYGGLIASRNPGSASLAQTEERLGALRILKERHPSLPIFAGNVLMRLSITASGKDSALWWAKVHRWSELHEPRTQEEQVEKARLQMEIPEQVIAQYEAARARNHAVNRMGIKLLAEGVLDFLLISQEDCTERGPHRAEQASLLALAVELNVRDRIVLCPGADEGTHVLLARALQTLSRGARPRVWPVWSDPAGADRVAPFEDRPVRATLGGLLDAAGAELAAAREEADLLLYIHTPGEKPVDLEKVTAPFREDLRPFAAALEADLAAGRLCALADVAGSNGGDPRLIQLVSKIPGLADLAGYAGWNTCANTLGTVLCHALLRLRRTQSGPAAHSAADRQHHTFLLERLADDGLYQGVVRGLVNRWIDARGLGRWNLPEEAHRETEAAVRSMLEPLVRDLHRDFLAGRYELERIHIALGWPRTFEVSLHVSQTEVTR